MAFACMSLWDLPNRRGKYVCVCAEAFVCLVQPSEYDVVVKNLPMPIDVDQIPLWC